MPMNFRLPSPLSPAERLKAYHEGRAPAPDWQGAEFVDGAETCLLFCEEHPTHPENRPLLCLCNTDEAGTILGEIWFAAADIPAIIEFLRQELKENYTARERRWLCQPDGPPLYFRDSPGARPTPYDVRPRTRRRRRLPVARVFLHRCDMARGPPILALTSPSTTNLTRRKRHT